MKIAIISDVHANLNALESVLGHIQASGRVDAVYHAGDAVGYGPEPAECVALIEAECDASIAGNHDQGLLGLTDVSRFNPIAASALEWTSAHITQEALQSLRSLSLTHKVKEPDMFMVHASPVEPANWEYVLSILSMKKAFEATEERITVIGHSHMPFITELDSKGRINPYGNNAGKVPFSQDARYLVNAGSVGQPRDQDPRAAYVLMDDEGMEIVRVEYDIDATVKKMQDRGMHVALSERIKYGF